MEAGAKVVREAEPLTTEIQLPAALATEAQRIAVEQDWTIPQAVLFLVKKGVEAQRATEAELKQAYDALASKHPEEKARAKDTLQRILFG